ncbi:MAG: alpha/beta hydrolase [Pseudanabaena sp. CRU_2_10]|nr:alpha/beta hydrolase [Pseudanabaena sp. CRU_2_10]
MNEADELNAAKTLAADRLYVGYYWPSEQPFFSSSLYCDTIANLDAIAKFLFALGGISLVVGLIAGLGNLLLQLVIKLTIQLSWLVPTTFLFWLAAFILLRLFVYHRDRYRAIHYGAPDLAEFFWRLDRSLTQTTQNLQNNILKVNLIGHSMGGLVLVNMLRVLSDKFGKDDVGSSSPDFRLVNAAGQPRSEVSEVAEDALINGEWQLQEIFQPEVQEMLQPPTLQNIRQFGEHLELIKIVLASPDIPLEFLRESRNNYVRSAISRCDQIFLMSSDRDIVLRYLSAVINWFSEPSIEMSAARLGNVHLKGNKERVSMSLGNSYPYIRVFLGLEPAVKSTSAYSLFQKFNYLDCTEMKVKGKGGVNGISCPLNPINGILIDIFNTLLYALQKWTKIDLHGGYFQTHTPSFELLKLLISFEGSKADLHTEIETTIRNQQSNIRYLPSHDWHMS